MVRGVPGEVARGMKRLRYHDLLFCACGEMYQVPPHHNGRHGKCPRCLQWREHLGTERQRQLRRLRLTERAYDRW